MKFSVFVFGKLGRRRQDVGLRQHIGLQVPVVMVDGPIIGSTISYILPFKDALTVNHLLPFNSVYVLILPEIAQDVLHVGAGFIRISPVLQIGTDTGREHRRRCYNEASLIIVILYGSAFIKLPALSELTVFRIIDGLICEVCQMLLRQVQRTGFIHVFRLGNTTAQQTALCSCDSRESPAGAIGTLALYRCHITQVTQIILGREAVRSHRPFLMTFFACEIERRIPMLHIVRQLLQRRVIFSCKRWTCQASNRRHLSNCQCNTQKNAPNSLHSLLPFLYRLFAIHCSCCRSYAISAYIYHTIAAG